MYQFCKPSPLYRTQASNFELSTVSWINDLSYACFNVYLFHLTDNIFLCTTATKRPLEPKDMQRVGLGTKFRHKLKRLIFQSLLCNKDLLPYIISQLSPSMN